MKFAEIDPGNAEWKGDLYANCWVVALLVDRIQGKKDAREHWMKALEHLAEIENYDPYV